ncbi:MAG TPA: ATP-binding protein [Mycobacteriales bacterium]|nr:ATP-binding protein [Mycobacteriales bacterium]
MTKRFLRPVSFSVVLLIVGLTIAGTIALRHNVADDEKKILTERGQEVTALLENIFAQEITSARVLAQVAITDEPQHIQQTFAAGAALIKEQGITALGIARPTANGFVVRAGYGDGLHPGQLITGRDAALLRNGMSAVAGATSLINEGAQSRIGLNIPVGHDVLFLYETLNPRDPVPAGLGLFESLRAAVYAAPHPSANTLVMTTERTVPITGGPTGRSTLTIGDDQWTLVYGENARLVDALSANMPWFLLGGGLGLAALVAILIETLARRQSYASHLVAERTKSLTEANTELQQAREFVGHLVAAGPIVGMVAAVSDLRLSYVTPNVSRLFAVEVEDAMAPGWLASRIDAEHRQTLELAVRRAGNADDEGEYERLELPLRIGDGTYRWLDVVVVRPSAAISTSEGSVLIYAFDVDDRHRAEEAAERANRSKSEFLSRMSHELRTPLNAILGYGQILQMDPLREDQEQPVAQILSGGRHLLELINEVLDISRIEVGRLSLSVEPVQVAEVIGTTIDMVRPAAAERGVSLDVIEGLEGLTARADRQRLRQILLNLLSNAVKYNRPGGSVTVSYELRDADMCRIAVTDTGLGIRPEDFDRVFAPFERLGADQLNVEGTGMGLTVCRQLATAMNGEMGLTSEVNRGSTFWVDLPLAAAPAHPAEDEQLAVEVAENDGAAGRTVLLVEDNPANVGLIERALSRLGNIRVVTATTGHDAIDLALSRLPDLVLLDVHLPDISGEEVLRTLRGVTATAAIPVVVVSADATPGQIERLLAAGATTYMTKPIDIRELLTLVSDATTAATP